ncbi:ABC transporter ATP binding protein [Methanocella paludicola SANAE]|uniref:ABC transporter ATP binding protein n=1 Tax=Methanocella paludicola (strain DSM 17711 / JCM 13418 / NBRC 101707 / SANAE) TaxID=304371 RepID=D1YW17_METPS|nr:ATP-binding cassette domain-containing protein [Methanocella paludicola]BAI60639.1 ABC transporter ATP binding protein [Methanocella paludicola SANAE]
MSVDNEKYWNIISAKYDSIVDRTIGDRLRPQVRERLEREKGLGRVAEFGCGTGYFTRTLAEVADSVVATDLSDEMLARAREGMKGIINVTIQKEDCMRTSFADRAFDAAFMALVINVTDNPMQALCEANRILKPGGVIIIANPDGSYIDVADMPGTMIRFSSNYGFAADYFTKEEFEAMEKSARGISDNDLRQMLPAAGFQITSLEILGDDTSASNLAMDYVRAVKTSDRAASSAGMLKNYERAEAVIVVKDLSKYYGKFIAVFGVSFTVRKGEVFALLGPNGAGKTTIVEVLELLKSPTRGFISILGSDVLIGAPVGNLFMAQDRNFADLKEKIGVLPQGFNSFELLTVYENIDYFARMYSKHVDADRLIDELGLREKRNALFKDLSGGLKQRVGIAIALINDPDIVFLDEPTTGLDPRSRRDVWEAIKRLKAKGKTIFLTTHYMDEAYQLADRVCVIHKGSIVAEGSPEDLINRYGGGNTLVIRECSPDALEPLAKAIPGSTIDGNNVMAKLQEDDGMASIAKAVEVIKSGGFACREIYVKKPTLEDVFLNLTGEKLIEGG